MTDKDTERPGAKILGWWGKLQPSPDGKGGDRAALARLRRCATAFEAAIELATLDLAYALDRGPNSLERVAVVAAVLAHVRDHTPGASAAQQLGEGPMSWLRFRRMMQAETAEEQITAFRRAIALADGRLNVADLGESLLFWSDERRQRWIYAFHQPPVPTDTPHSEETVA